MQEYLLMLEMKTTIIIDPDDIISPLTHTPDEVKRAATLLISTDFIGYVDGYVKTGSTIPLKQVKILLPGTNLTMTIYRLDPEVANNIVDLAFDARENDYPLRIQSTSHSGKKTVIIFS